MSRNICLIKILTIKNIKVAGQLSYWPSDLQLFSTSGCKRVAQKVDLVVEELEETTRTEL